MDNQPRPRPKPKPKPKPRPKPKPKPRPRPKPKPKPRPKQQKNTNKKKAPPRQPRQPQQPQNSQVNPQNTNRPTQNKKAKPQKKKMFTKKYSELTPRERAIYLKRKQKQLLKQEQKLKKSNQRKKRNANIKSNIKKHRDQKKDPYAINHTTTYPQGERRLRKNKRRYKKNYTLYYILLTIISSITLYSLSVTIWFEIEEIVVIGDIDIAYEEIIDISGIELYENLVKLSEKSVSQRVRDNYITIETVELNKKFPNKVEIEVTMAQPKALLYYDRLYYTLSESDRIISYATRNYYNDVDLVSFIGLELENMDLGDYLYNIDKDLLENIDRLLKAIDENSFNDITYVDISSLVDIRFYVDDIYEIKAGGFTEISYKLHCAKWIIDLQDDEFVVKGVIDVTVDDGMYYLRPAIEIKPNL